MLGEKNGPNHHVVVCDFNASPGITAETEDGKLPGICHLLKNGRKLQGRGLSTPVAVIGKEGGARNGARGRRGNNALSGAGGPGLTLPVPNVCWLWELITPLTANATNISPTNYFIITFCNDTACSPSLALHLYKNNVVWN